MTQKKCRCGKEVETLTSFFEKGTNVRVTVCNDCAELHGLKDEKKYYSVPYNNLTAEQKTYNTSAD